MVLEREVILKRKYCLARTVLDYKYRSCVMCLPNSYLKRKENRNECDVSILTGNVENRWEHYNFDAWVMEDLKIVWLSFDLELKFFDKIRFTFKLKSGVGYVCSFYIQRNYSGDETTFNDEPMHNFMESFDKKLLHTVKLHNNLNFDYESKFYNEQEFDETDEDYTKQIDNRQVSKTFMVQQNFIKTQSHNYAMSYKDIELGKLTEHGKYKDAKLNNEVDFTTMTNSITSTDYCHIQNQYNIKMIDKSYNYILKSNHINKAMCDNSFHRRNFLKQNLMHTLTHRFILHSLTVRQIGWQMREEVLLEIIDIVIPDVIPMMAH